MQQREMPVDSQAPLWSLLTCFSAADLGLSSLSALIILYPHPSAESLHPRQQPSLRPELRSRSSSGPMPGSRTAHLSMRKTTHPHVQCQAVPCPLPRNLYLCHTPLYLTNLLKIQPLPLSPGGATPTLTSLWHLGTLQISGTEGSHWDFRGQQTGGIPWISAFYTQCYEPRQAQTSKLKSLCPFPDLSKLGVEAEAHYEITVTSLVQQALGPWKQWFRAGIRHPGPLHCKNQGAWRCGSSDFASRALDPG